MDPANGARFAYCSFILRCWCETPQPAGGAPVWRFSLAPVSDPHSSCGFATTDDLVAYLRAHLAGQLKQGGKDDLQTT